MYTIFHKLIDKIRSISTEEIIAQTMDDDDLKFIEELNKEQLENSKNTEGKSLGVYHSATANTYNEYRSTKISAGGDVKLYDTGALYESIKAEFLKDKIEINSDYDDQILGYLTSVYGDFIGLTKENLEYVANRIKPKIARTFRNRLLSKL